MSLSSATLNRLAKDTGCSEHDDCLTCPFPNCIYDTRRVNEAAKQRHSLIRSMSKYLSNDRIAEQLGIHVRTVQRALKEK